MGRLAQHAHGLRRGLAQHLALLPAPFGLHDDLLAAFVEPLGRVRFELAQKTHDAVANDVGCHDEGSFTGEPSPVRAGSSQEPAPYGARLAQYPYLDYCSELLRKNAGNTINDPRARQQAPDKPGGPSGR